MRAVYVLLGFAFGLAIDEAIRRANWERNVAPEILPCLAETESIRCGIPSFYAQDFYDR